MLLLVSPYNERALYPLSISEHMPTVSAQSITTSDTSFFCNENGHSKKDMIKTGL